jgi:hypothetical protein
MADLDKCCTPNAAADPEDDLDASTHSYVCKFNNSSQKWECTAANTEYKKDVLQEVIRSHDNKDGRRTIDQLKDFGCVF